MVHSQTRNTLFTAGLLFTLGMLTHQLPVRAIPGKYWLPTDWKAFARIGLGIMTVHEVNKGMGWRPPPWLGALEAVTIINPLALGISIKSTAQYLIMAPLVALVVETANLVNERVAKPLQSNCNVPQFLTRLSVSLGLGALGVTFYPKIFKHIAGAAAKTNLLGKTVKLELEQLASGKTAMAGAAFVTCARGCSPGSIICLSETAEVFGGMVNWLKAHGAGKTQGDSHHHA